MPFNHNDRVFRNGELAWRVLEKRLIAVTPKDTSIHRFNEAATFIWNFLEKKGRSVEEIVEAVAGEYGLPRDQALSDASAFLEKALKKEIIVIRHQGGQ